MKKGMKKGSTKPMGSSTSLALHLEDAEGFLGVEAGHACQRAGGSGEFGGAEGLARGGGSGGNGREQAVCGVFSEFEHHTGGGLGPGLLQLLTDLTQGRLFDRRSGGGVGVFQRLLLRVGTVFFQGRRNRRHGGMDGLGSALGVQRGPHLGQRGLRLHLCFFRDLVATAWLLGRCCLGNSGLWSGGLLSLLLSRLDLGFVPGSVSNWLGLGALLLLLGLRL